MLLISSIQVLILGSIYTLSRKFQNLQVSEGIGGKSLHFHHPLYQVLWLFIGMALMLPFKYFVKKEDRDQNKERISSAVMFFPSFCDVCATIFDSTGLIYTHVSVHQMLKGFIVIFTGLISYYFFQRKFTKSQLGGILIVVLGLVLVGLSNIHSYNSKFAPRPVLGNFLVIAAQFFLALMFVYEEIILRKYDVNVFEIVGWEGVWGVLISSIFIGFFYILPGRDFGSWENPIQATLQLEHNMYLLGAVMCSSLVIGPFNYYGTNLTKYSSAMHRCLIDASRMLVVWIISIISKWEQFKIQQAIGYMFVLIGNLIYYEIIKIEKTPEQTHLPLPRADETTQFSEKENVINDKEKSTSQTISDSVLEKEVQNSDNFFNKIYNFFFRRENKEKNEKKHIQVDKFDVEKQKDLNHDEKQGLKD